jgi:beta-lactamase regulating signal transducer with metallopeptidase domain
MNALIILLNDWAAAWSEAMWRVGWIGTVAMLLVWAVNRWSARIPTFARCWLWRLAFLKWWAVLVVIPPIELQLLPPRELAAVPAAPAPSRSTQPAATVPRGEQSASQRSPTGPELLRNPSETIRLSSSFWLLAAWCCGVVGCVALIARNWRSMRRLLHQCQPISDHSLYEAYAGLCTELGVRRRPRLLRIDAAVSPQLVGVFRPSIILPTRMLANCALVDVRTILAHELAHWSRRDLVWNWLPTLTHALFFFHPAVWLANREWRLNQEMACDEAALRIANTPTAEYGRLLLSVVRACQPAWHPTFLAVGVSQSFDGLSRRMRALARYRHSSPLGHVCFVVLIALAALLGLVPWKITAQETAPQLADKVLFQSEPPAVAEKTQPDEAEANNRVADISATAPGANAQALSGRIIVDAVLRRTEGEPQAEMRGAIISIDPNTGQWRQLAEGGHSARVSPDGSLVAFNKGDETWICDSQHGGNARLVSGVDGRPVWSPDGKEIVVSSGDVNEEDKKPTPEKPVWFVETWKVALDGSGKTWLPVPSTDFIEDWSPDGNWFVASSDRHAPFGRGYQLYLLSPDATTQMRLTEGRGLNVYVRFSPDGKRIVFLHQEAGGNSVRLIEIESGEETEILADEGIKRVEMACWSPDGKYLAIQRHDWQIGPDGRMTLSGGTESKPRIEILDLATKERRPLVLQNAEVRWLGHPHWK